jgi:transposase-like protein
MIAITTTTWIALVMFTNTLAIQVLQEFPNEKECEKYMNTIIEETQQQQQQYHYLTCISSLHMNGNEVPFRSYLRNILLPTPT